MTRHYCGPHCQEMHRRLRPQAVPFRVTASDHLKDAAEILLGVIVLLVLFIGLPMLLLVAFG